MLTIAYKNRVQDRVQDILILRVYLQLSTPHTLAFAEWSDESDFEQDSDSGSDYMPESDWEIGLCNTMLITGPHGIGKTAMVQALAEELGYKVSLLLFIGNLALAYYSLLDE